MIAQYSGFNYQITKDQTCDSHDSFLFLEHRHMYHITTPYAKPLGIADATEARCA
jgi:hypothetical protein